MSSDNVSMDIIFGFTYVKYVHPPLYSHLCPLFIKPTQPSGGDEIGGRSSNV